MERAGPSLLAAIADGSAQVLELFAKILNLVA
jgi:hypothetical protein